jgi:hypothetical protein
MDVKIETLPVDLTANKTASGIKECDFNDKAVKEAWTSAFMNEGGFQYVCDALISYDIQQLKVGANDRIFDFKQVTFMMTLIKVFLES